VSFNDVVDLLQTAALLYGIYLMRRTVAQGMEMLIDTIQESEKMAKRLDVLEAEIEALKERTR